MKWSNHASSGANFKHGDLKDKKRLNHRTHGNARKRNAEGDHESDESARIPSGADRGGEWNEIGQ